MTINKAPSNKRIRELMTQLEDGSLQANPDFQRRKVWTDKDKVFFLKTILDGYPFPEIYIATESSKLDLETGKGKDYIVDGQQRITTIYEYFKSSNTFKPGNAIASYADLDAPQKRAFLEYEVAVRNLGSIELDVIKDIFQRINSTSYDLNAMELNNAQYDGEFMQLGKKISDEDFFDRHHVFAAKEIKRMQDIEYVLIIMATLSSNYFTSNKEVEQFLRIYNNDFPKKDDLETGISNVLRFIEDLGLPEDSRAWKKNDLFNLIIELYKALIENRKTLPGKKFGKILQAFYANVNNAEPDSTARNIFGEYKYIVSQSTTSLKSRRRRGEIIRDLISKSAA